MPTRTNNPPNPPLLIPPREVVDAAKAYALGDFYATHSSLLINYNRENGWNLASLASIACRVLVLALDETERVLDARNWESPPPHLMSEANPSRSHESVNEYLKALVQAPESQCDPAITKKLLALIDKPYDDQVEGVLHIMDECAYFSLASDFFMRAARWIPYGHTHTSEKPAIQWQVPREYRPKNYEEPNK